MGPIIATQGKRMQEVSLFWASLETKNFWFFRGLGIPREWCNLKANLQIHTLAPSPISHQKTWNMVHPSYFIYNVSVPGCCFIFFCWFFCLKSPKMHPKNCPNHQPKYCWWARCNSVCSTWPRCKVSTTSGPPKNTIENIYENNLYMFEDKTPWISFSEKKNIPNQNHQNQKVYTTASSWLNQPNWKIVKMGFFPK